MNKKIFLLLSIITLSLLSISCKRVQFVTVCYEQKSDFKKSEKKHPDLTAVTVSEMSTMLQKDKGIKIVAIYQPCEIQSFDLLNQIERYKTSGKEKLNVYFIANHCGRLQDITPYFESKGIKETKYYFRDNTIPFASHPTKDAISKSEREQNINKALFTNGEEIAPVRYIRAINFYIVNKEGKVKLAKYSYTDKYGKTSSVIAPLWPGKFNTRLEELDFDVIDEIEITRNTKDAIYRMYFYDEE
ncbi:MAG: hypothetical protein Q4D14_01335 [Bacteroidales bacterium]|nr:hypothetical protein [Bacteroidales bacterium]